MCFHPEVWRPLIRASFDALATDALDEVVVILAAYSTENSEEPHYTVTYVELQVLTHFRPVTLAVTLRYMLPPLGAILTIKPSSGEMMNAE